VVIVSGSASAPTPLLDWPAEAPGSSATSGSGAGAK
jgi:hypothetical protein